MATFFEVTTLHNNKRKALRIKASSMSDARAIANQNGVLVINVKAAKTVSKHDNKFQLSIFIQELTALLEAGLVIVEAIEALYESYHDNEQKLVLKELLNALYSGCQFSDALATLPDIFPPLLINTAASSEQTGLLAITLKRFLQYDKRMETLRKRIKATMLYPCVVIGAGCLIIFFLLGFIIPRFAMVFDGMKNITGSAQFIVWWGHMTREHGMALLVATCSCGIMLIFACRSRTLRNTLLRQLLYIPHFRKQYWTGIFVRFYRTLGLLLQGGIPVLEALTLTSTLLPTEYQPRLNKMMAEIQAGKSLSWTLSHYELTTPVASRLLSVGENSGELPEMCERIAAFYDEILERAIETFSKIFEPVLMLIVGGLVGLIVFLLYMPIFEIAGGLS
ncbi:type II secretion system protein [Enterobacter roggenkampii]|nr:type II secretion system protein [Enterobacter roggenkampii]MCG5130312.1 type II secretion system F family protein [Enterobacter mori]